MANNQKTLKEMRDIIGRGESVIYNGRIIDKLENLPSATEVAQSDPDQAAAILANAMRARQEADNVIAAIESIKKAKAEGQQEEDNKPSTFIVPPVGADQGGTSTVVGIDPNAVAAARETRETDSSLEGEATKTTGEDGGENNGESQSRSALSEPATVQSKGLSEATSSRKK